MQLCWKKAAIDHRSPNGTKKELIVHGAVFELVRKGVLKDTPLHCYASYARSRYSLLLQFGHGKDAITCDLLDKEQQRVKNHAQVYALLAQQGIEPHDLLRAGISGVGAETQDKFYSCLRRFVEYEFGSRAF